MMYKDAILMISAAVLFSAVLYGYKIHSHFPNFLTSNKSAYEKAAQLGSTQAVLAAPLPSAQLGEELRGLYLAEDSSSLYLSKDGGAIFTDADTEKTTTHGTWYMIEASQTIVFVNQADKNDKKMFVLNKSSHTLTLSELSGSDNLVYTLTHNY